MAFKLSTGLRNSMLKGGSFQEALADGFIRILSGTPPATADAAETGTLLCIVSDAGGGTGLDLADPASGSIAKDSGQAWNGLVLATGTATYFRYVGNADTAAISTTQPRLQGTVATSGADCNMTSTSLSSGATQTIDAASFSLPTF